MKVNDTKWGLRIKLKRQGKTLLISNTLNIEEVNYYKYLGVIINHTLLIKIKGN